MVNIDSKSLKLCPSCESDCLDVEWEKGTQLNFYIYCFVCNHKSTAAFKIKSETTQECLNRATFIWNEESNREFPKNEDVHFSLRTKIALEIARQSVMYDIEGMEKFDIDAIMTVINKHNN